MCAGSLWHFSSILPSARSRSGRSRTHTSSPSSSPSISPLFPFRLPAPPTNSCAPMKSPSQSFNSPTSFRTPSGNSSIFRKLQTSDKIQLKILSQHWLELCFSIVREFCTSSNHIQCSSVFTGLLSYNTTQLLYRKMYSVFSRECGLTFPTFQRLIKLHILRLFG